MKIKFVFGIVASILFAGIILFTVDPAQADMTELLAAPSFGIGERLKANGVDLQVPRDGGGTNVYSVPCVVDWNEDGRKDLLVGCFYYGYIYLYLNSGTNNAPVFTTGSKLKADGVDISVTYGSYMGAYPQITDWNADGKKDLLVGDSQGKITYYRNTGSNANPVLTKVGFIQAGGLDILVNQRSTPVVVDWNNDGKKDLVVGEHYDESGNQGYVRLYLNIGTNTAPAFSSSYQRIRAGGSDIRFYATAPEVCDLDGDGKKDLIVGESNSSVYFYKNTGTDANPAFASGERLMAGNSYLTISDYYSRPEAVDWNGDGKIDLLLGEFNGYVNLFKNAPPILPDISVDPGYWDFGPVVIGNYLDQTFVIKNEGNADLNVSSIIIVSTNTEFSFRSGDSPFSLAPGQHHNLVVRFEPKSVGRKAAPIKIYSNDLDENPKEVGLNGDGLDGGNPVPDISVSPGYWDYGPVVIGNYLDKTFVIKNEGNAALNVSSIVIVINNTEFRITSGDSPFPLAPGKTHDLKVRFEPITPGRKAAPIKIYSNDPDENPLEVGLNGDGVYSYQYEAKRIPQQVSLPVIDGVLNESFWAVVDEDTLSDGGVPDEWGGRWYNFRDNLVTWKAVWSQSTNQIYVAVKVIDDIRGKFDDNDPNRTPYWPWQDESIEFYTDGNNSGGDYLGKYDVAQQWRVTGQNIRNLAYYPAYDKFYVYNGTDFITAVTFGTDGNWNCEAVFKIYDNLPTNRKTLAIGDVIGWNIWYNDSDNESSSDGYFERDHQTGWIYTGPAWSNADHFGDLILGGDIQIALPDISVVPDSWYFGEIFIGQSAEKTFGIKNDGSADLNIYEMEITGTNSSEFKITSGGFPITISPGVTRNITLSFSPNSVGYKSANFTISSNDPDENPFQVSLAGTGKSIDVPDISSKPTSWDFGPVVVNSYSDKVFEIKNNGLGELKVSATTLSGTNASEFGIDNGGAFYLSAGQNRYMTIRFSTTTPGSKSATLNIYSNDPDENPYQIPLTGTGTLSSVILFPNALANQMAGSEFLLTVEIGSAAKLVTNLFGLSFNLNFTKTDFLDVLTPHSVNVLPGSFIGSDIVFFQSVDESMGKIGIGESRKMGQGGVNGYGTVAQIKFFINSSTPNGTSIQFSLSDVNATDPTGAAISLNTSMLTIQVISGTIVWPGDTDNNGIVNQADILPIGLYWSIKGPARTCHPNESQWLAHTAKPWNPLKATYADANGNGTVDQGDILPIGLNWNRTHSNLALAKMNPNRNEVSTSSAKLLIEISGELLPNKDITIFIVAKNIKKLFGLSYELIYTPTTLLSPKLIEPGPTNVLGNDVIVFSMDERNTRQDTGKVSFGISRKSGQGGVDVDSGIVTTIQAHVSPDAILGQSLSNLTLRNILANDELGNPIDIDTTYFNLITTVKDKSIDVSNEFGLDQNYPNPFNPSTIIHFRVKKRVAVKLTVYDLLGKEIETLVNKIYDPGEYEVSFNADGLSSGVYLYHIQLGDHSEMRKMVKFK